MSLGLAFFKAEAKLTVLSSTEQHLKDVFVVVYQVHDGVSSVAVLPVALEERGTKHHGQVLNVHLVTLGEALHAETHGRAQAYSRKGAGRVLK